MDYNMGLSKHFFPLTFLSLATSLSFSTHASSDEGCFSPSIQINSNSYNTCSNLPVLDPANDNKTNMYLMLIDMGFAKANPITNTDKIWLAEYGIVPFDTETFTGKISSSIPNQRQATPNQPEAIYDEKQNSITLGETQFIQQVQASTQLSATEKQQLITARQAIQANPETALAFVAIDPKWSQPAQQFASYLNASIAFYNSDYITAGKIYTVLSTVNQPWIKETSQYMLIRVAINQAYRTGTDTYGDFDVSKVDPALSKAIFTRINDYLKTYPQGLYRASARGLLRRGYWFSGQNDKLVQELTWQLRHPKDPNFNLDIRILPDELDRQVFSSEKLNPNSLKDPFFLTIYDLMQMRKPSGEDKHPIAWAQLQQQQAYFKQQPELFQYLQALHLFFIQKQPAQALNYLPKNNPSKINSYLQLSQVMLKGRILEAQQAQVAYSYWNTMLERTSNSYQYATLESALAINMQKNKNYAGFLAKDSKIKQRNLRKIFIQKIADQTSLEQMLASKDTNPDERNIALDTLLQEAIMQQDYSTFIQNFKYVPKNAAQYQGYSSKNEAYKAQPPLSIFVWQGKKISPEIQCSSLIDTVTRLSKNPNDRLASVCLGEAIRETGNFLDTFTNESHPDILGEIKKPVKNQIFYRGTIYQKIIQEAQPSELQAYALYRAIQCYAPSGTNECGDKAVNKATRKQWFQKLKTQYPNTTWAKSLKYYW
ncbi:hypothetical protein ACX1N0_03455 [Acinetobacter sp. ANC 4635]|uniref:hypothetical protein n=1 Tax=Acinetobacter sp. ANC 4635 TaxID=2529846 RepID=UPI001D18B51D|nr:hypothetical protein [Acinetobacter sp. ANC 4635]